MLSFHPSINPSMYHQLTVNYPLILRFQQCLTLQQNLTLRDHLSDVDIALHDGVETSLMNSNDFHSQERRLEKRLGTTEPLVAHRDHLAMQHSDRKH